MTESAETRLSLLELNHKNVMEKLDAIIERFDDFEIKLDKALDKKADIWVEKALSWVIYTVIGAVLLALIYLVIQK